MAFTSPVSSQTLRQTSTTPHDADMTPQPEHPSTSAPYKDFCATTEEPLITKRSTAAQSVNDPTDIECDDLTDPVLYSGRRLKSQDINTLLKAGPCQPDSSYKYPLDSGRAFTPQWFLCDMPDGTQYGRHWLSYSLSTNKAYCIPCIAFSGPRGSEVWSTAGFDDWRNGSRDIKRHESSAEHRNAEIARLQWRQGKTVGQMTSCHSSAIVDDNRKVLHCVVDCIRFLASESPRCSLFGVTIRRMESSSICSAL